MIYILLNLPAILAATVAGLAIGLAYHASGAGAPAAAAGRTRGGWARLALVVAAAEFWLASILAGALILAPDEAGAWTMAIGSAVVIWIGFVAPALLATQLYRGTPIGQALADCGHWLLAMTAQAAVLQALGLTPPPS